MDSSSFTGPYPKRTKLNNSAEDELVVDSDIADELDGDHCSICLQMLLDRTVVPECSHEFCFECIITWSEQSRRCPLCSRTIGPYLIHHIRSNYDYQKYHLPPLRSSPPPIQPLRRTRSNRLPARERRWGRSARREQDVADELERAIDRRRWVYQNQLFAKHVGSNTFSRYRPFPTPAQFAASQDYISRATIFIRRELRVWANLDVEFLTTFILSLLKAIDIRSESAIKLLAEFLDMERQYIEGGRFPNAEHFAHELYSFLRSPFKSLSAYDVNVQYDAPKGVNRPADNDDHTATGRLNIKEVISPSDESHARPRNRQHSRLHDGGGYSWSKLNDQDTADKFVQGSSGSARSPATSNGSGLSALQRNDSSNKPENAYLLQLEDDQQGEHFSITSHDSTRTNAKGKRRALFRDSCNPVTQEDGGHGHVYGEINHNDSRTFGEVEDGRTSGNAPVASDKSVSAGKAGDSGARISPHQSQFATTNSRTRNPLLIAQAHLESEPRNKRKQVKTSTLVPTEIEGDPPKLRSSSEIEGKRPSLLSRISEASPPTARTNDTTTHLSKACMESEDKDVPAKPENESFRAKLLHRLEVERAIQAEQVGFPASSAPENTVEIESPRLDEISVASKLEEDARLRARSRMKLALEKHLSASYPGVGNTRTVASVENTAKSTSREGLLRNVLESRRRVGRC